MQTIYFGAPGTGKSYFVNELLVSKGITNDRIFRTTFYPEYTYSDFTGQLLPTIVYSGPNKGNVTYSFCKGIFTLALEKAYEDTSKEVFLIIEEMSRGNCSAIFGDIFQLLDRENSGINKGYSRYFINNEMISKDIIALPDGHIKLPPNFSIVGTVNASDQNVFVLDTAFKRRFEWSYISTEPIPKTKPHLNNIPILINDGVKKYNVNWLDLYGTLNIFISETKWLDLGEDKQIGQFFIEFDPLGNATQHKAQLQNKLLYYLWFDIQHASYKGDLSIFDNTISNYYVLYKAFNNDEKIFSDKFLNCLTLWINNKLT